MSNDEAEVHKAFHDLAVKERDAAWTEVRVLRLESEALRAEVERLKANGEARERVMRRESDLLREAQREVDTLRARLRLTAQTLVDELGAGEPENAESLAARAVSRMVYLRSLADQNGYDAGVYARRMSEAQERSRKSRSDERAAVVAFLRETLATSETAHASDDLDYAISIIERGEHRREEER